MVTDSPLSVQRDYFGSRLRRRAQERHSWLCVGLDPDLRRLPRSVDRSAAGVVNFCTAIVSATVQAAVCFKINFAFFEALGPSGWEALVQVRATIPPEVPVIADAKRGDIGNTSRAYAEAILGVLDFDAVTVSPYLGHDSVSAFLEYPGKA